MPLLRGKVDSQGGSRRMVKKVLVWIWACVYAYARTLWENPIFMGWVLGVGTVLAVVEL